MLRLCTYSFLSFVLFWMVYFSAVYADVTSSSSQASDQQGLRLAQPYIKALKPVEGEQTPQQVFEQFLALYSTENKNIGQPSSSEKQLQQLKANNPKTMAALLKLQVNGVLATQMDTPEQQHFIMIYNLYSIADNDMEAYLEELSKLPVEVVQSSFERIETLCQSENTLQESFCGLAQLKPYFLDNLMPMVKKKAQYEAFILAFSNAVQIQSWGEIIRLFSDPQNMALAQEWVAQGRSLATNPHNTEGDKIFNNKIMLLLREAISIDTKTWAFFPTLFTMDMKSDIFAEKFMGHLAEIKALQSVSAFFCEQVADKNGQFCQGYDLLKRVITHFQGLPEIHKCAEEVYALQKQGKEVEAQQKLRECLEGFKPTQPESGVPLEGMQAMSSGEKALQQNNCQKALESFEKALMLYRKIFKDQAYSLEYVKQQPEFDAVYSEAEILNRQAEAYSCLGDYIKAKALAHRALEITRNIEDTYTEVHAESTLCHIHTLLYECKEAITHCETGMTRLKTLTEKTTPLSDIDKATLQFLDTTDFSRLEVELNYRMGGTYLQCAPRTKNKQQSPLAKGEEISYVKGYQYLHSALEKALKLENKTAQSRIYAQLCNHYVPYFWEHQDWNNRTNFGHSFENDPQVVSAIQQAREAYRQEFSPEMAHFASEFFARNVLHTAWLKKGHMPIQIGVQYCQHALNLARENGNTQAESAALLYQGRLYAVLGKFNALFAVPHELSQFPANLQPNLQPILEQYWQQAEAIKREMFPLENLGQELPLAQEMLKKSLSLHKELQAPPEQLWQIQVQLAELYRFTGELKTAADYYQEAIKSIESVRSQFDDKSYAQKTSDDNNTEEIDIRFSERPLSYQVDPLYSVDKMSIYDDAIEVYFQLYKQYKDKQYAQQAWQIFERKQGRRILDDLGASGARRFHQEDIPKLEEEIRKEEEQLRQDIQNEYTKPAAKRDIKKLNTFAERKENLEGKKKNLKEKIQRDPAYAALKAPKPVHLKALQQEVLRDNEVLLVYHALTQNPEVAPCCSNTLNKPAVSRQATGLLWVISAHTFEMYPLAGTFKEIGDRVNCAYKELSKNPTEYLKSPKKIRVGCAYPNLGSNLQQLYAYLIPQNIRTELNGKTLYIIPDNVLYKFPFETLITAMEDNSVEYLIEQNPIAYLSSASLLKVIRDNTWERKDARTMPLLAFADPAYHEDKMGKCELVQLNESRAEAEGVRDLLVPDSLKEKALYLGSDVNKDNLLKLNKDNTLASSRYLLFSMHGVFSHPARAKCGVKGSALALMSPYHQAENRLDISDIYNLRLNSDLVMLSACDTGGVKEAVKDHVGLRGLTSAFLYAGSASVGVNLWGAEDTVIKNLTIKLFEGLKNHQQTMVSALQCAKLSVLRGNNKVFRDPRYWAAPVLFGEGAILE